MKPLIRPKNIFALVGIALRQIVTGQATIDVLYKKLIKFYPKQLK